MIIVFFLLHAATTATPDRSPSPTAESHLQAPAIVRSSPTPNHTPQQSPTGVSASTGQAATAAAAATGIGPLSTTTVPRSPQSPHQSQLSLEDSVPPWSSGSSRTTSPSLSSSPPRSHVQPSPQRANSDLSHSPPPHNLQQGSSCEARVNGVHTSACTETRITIDGVERMESVL